MADDGAYSLPDATTEHYSLLTRSWDDIEKLFGLGGKANVSLNDPTANAATAKRAGADFSHMGVFMSVMGAASSAIGNFYAAKTQQYQERSQASSFKFASDMAAINARSAEYDAQSILESGKSQVAQYTMEAGQQKAAAKTSMAARGIVLGEGSARDVEASMDIVKGIDVMTINSNAVRAAEAERTQATNYKNQSLLYGVSAKNANASADSISPFGAMSTSLLGSASGIASQWQWQRKIDELIARGGA